MHVDEAGPGTPVLLLHGAGVAGWMWRPALTRLDVPVRAIVPDLPGHGRSADRAYRSHAETCAELVDLLRRRAPGGALVAGFSLGAQLAILLAATRPDLVRGAVIVSAETLPARLPGPTLALLSAAAPLARQPWFARLQAGQLAIPDDLLDDYVRDSARVSRATLVASVGENLRFRLPPAWSRFAGPTLVMVGSRERRLMRASAGRTHEALPGSELLTVPGCGHGIPFEQPALFAQVLTERVHTLPG